MNINRIQVFLTIDIENLPFNFQEILKEEQAVVAKWKEEGVLEHLYLRNEKNGAVLVFKNLDENQVKELMTELPFFKIKKSIDYYSLIQQF